MAIAFQLPSSVNVGAVVLVDVNGNPLTSGVPTTISGPLDRRADAQAVSVALSTEDVALLNSLITKLNGGLPAALAAGGGMKVEGVAGGVAQPIALAGKITNPGDTPALMLNAANATDTGANVLGAGMMSYDTTNAVVRRVVAVRADGVAQYEGMAVGELVYNGTTLDRRRGVQAVTLLASASRTVTTNSADQTNYNHRGLILTVDVSVIGTGSITPSIQVKDSISGNYKTIWTAAAALTGNGTAVYALYPGAAAASFTEAVALVVGRTWRLALVSNNANAVTASASADMGL